MSWRQELFWHFAGVVLLLVSFTLLPFFGFHMLTGHWPPVHIEESLQSPVGVRGWNREGLLLEDGRLVRLPKIKALPAQSEALTQATAHGVEITPEGRVIGLVNVWHWCGNDPVRRHLVRVDLSHLLMFVGGGQFDLPPKNVAAFDVPPFAAFSDNGMNISWYVSFPLWCDRLRQAGW